MQVRRLGIYVTCFAATLLVSSVAYSATKKWLSAEASMGIRALLQIAYAGNTTTGDPVAIRVPATVDSTLFCDTIQGNWKCWGESELICPTAMETYDLDSGQALTCELDCDPPSNGECDCDIVSCS